ncbi:MAG: trigger factor [Fidelibacterota bacterium]
MNVKLIHSNRHSVLMEVTVPWVELEDSYERTISRFRQGVKLAGFRKGKVPRRVLLQHYRSDIQADFVQESVDLFYRTAVKEKEISPVGQAKIDRVEVREGQPLTFTASVEVEPSVDLPDYRKKLRVKKNVYVPDEEDVDIYLKELQRQHAELKTVESGSKSGHFLLVDMQEVDPGGIPIVGRKVEDRYIVVGEGLFGGENLEKLTGLKAGDRTVISASDGNQSNPMMYEITVKNVQEEILPEFDEEFIRGVDKSAATLDDLRDVARERIQERLDRQSEARLNEALIDALVQRTDVEVPPAMLESYLAKAVEDSGGRNGATVDEEELRNEMKPGAVKNLKWYLIRKALIEAEGLEVTEKEVSQRVDEIANRPEVDERTVRRFYRTPSNRDHLREDILDEKLFDLLKSLAKIEEVRIHTREVRKQGVASSEPFRKGLS